MKWLGWSVRLGIIVVAGFMFNGLVPVVLNEWRGIEACPRLGAVPACYVVGLGYSLMAVAVIFAPRRLTALFLLGWTPVFALALTGSTMEILEYPTCPASPTGTPMCYYSLAVVSLVLPAFWVGRRAVDSDIRVEDGGEFLR